MKAPVTEVAEILRLTQETAIECKRALVEDELRLVADVNAIGQAEEGRRQ